MMTLRSVHRRIVASGATGGPVRRALVVVEMALVTPLLLLLIVGAIQYGSVFHLKSNMFNAAREGTRLLAVKDGTEAQARQRATNLLAGWALNFTITIRVPPANDPADRDAWIEISVPMAEAATMLNSFGLLPGGSMRAKVTMRKE